MLKIKIHSETSFNDCKVSVRYLEHSNDTNKLYVKNKLSYTRKYYINRLHIININDALQRRTAVN